MLDSVEGTGSVDEINDSVVPSVANGVSIFASVVAIGSGGEVCVDVNASDVVSSGNMVVTGRFASVEDTDSVDEGNDMVVAVLSATSVVSILASVVGFGSSGGTFVEMNCSDVVVSTEAVVVAGRSVSAEDTDPVDEVNDTVVGVLSVVSVASVSVVGIDCCGEVSVEVNGSEAAVSVEDRVLASMVVVSGTSVSVEDTGFVVEKLGSVVAPSVGEIVVVSETVVSSDRVEDATTLEGIVVASCIVVEDSVVKSSFSVVTDGDGASVSGGGVSVVDPKPNKVLKIVVNIPDDSVVVSDEVSEDWVEEES